MTDPSSPEEATPAASIAQQSEPTRKLNVPLTIVSVGAAVLLLAVIFTGGSLLSAQHRVSSLTHQLSVANGKIAEIKTARGDCLAALRDESTVTADMLDAGTDQTSAQSDLIDGLYDEATIENDSASAKIDDATIYIKKATALLPACKAD